MEDIFIFNKSRYKKISQNNSHGKLLLIGKKMISVWTHTKTNKNLSTQLL